MSTSSTNSVGALQPSFSNANDIRLPHDVVVLIGEMLAEDGMQQTLAALNVVSRVTHEGTLPSLYRKLELKERNDFAYVTGYDVPTGWKRTRYISMYKTHLAVLQTIDRFVRLHNGQPIGDLDVTIIFPQLVCMCGESSQRQASRTKSTYRLELFRPMSLDDIHQMFDAERRIEDIQDPCYQKYVCVYQVLANMTGLCIRKGASLLPSSISECKYCINQWKKPRTDFIIEIESEVPDEGIIDSMKIVLDLIARATDPEERQPLLGISAKKKRLILMCHPPVFEAFIRVFESRQPLLLVMRVELFGEGTTISDMQRYLDPLAALYARHWVHNADLYESTTVPFVWIHVSIPLSERYADEAKRYHDLRGALAGHLDVSQRVDTDPAPTGDQSLGFHSQVLEGIAFGPEDMLEDGEMVFARNYPCVDAETIEMEWRLASDEDDDYDEEDDEDYEDPY